MRIQITCQNSETGELFDLSSLAGNIQHATTLYGQPGKLTFTLQDDPNGLKPLSPGSVVALTIDNIGIFYGYLFTVNTDMSKTWKLTAYDQMRYLQNQDTKYTSGKSASQIFQQICADTVLKHRVDVPTSFIVPDYLHQKKSYYSMIEYAIQLTDINDTKYYYVKDDFGTLVFTEIQKSKTNVIIGDKSLLTAYQYELSIDKDTYNTIKVTRDNENTGKRDVWIETDSSTQKKWGKLQYIVDADKDMNEAQIKQKAANLLKWKNRPTKTMKLTALGTQITTDTAEQIIDALKLTAGAGFKLQIDDLQIMQDMWITDATHSFTNDLHTFSLDVFI